MPNHILSLCISNHSCWERITYSTASRRRSGSGFGMGEDDAFALKSSHAPDHVAQ
jgi:hypothetical protein